VVALEGEIGVDEPEVTRIGRVEESRGFHPVGEQFDAARGNAGIGEAWAQRGARVGGRLRGGKRGQDCRCGV
jgi:hypothetical protein